MLQKGQSENIEISVHRLKTFFEFWQALFLILRIFLLYRYRSMLDKNSKKSSHKKVFVVCKFHFLRKI